MSELDTKKCILRAATALFSSQGLKSTNIRQIAQKAKANPALISYYFGCKEKLLFSCLTEMASERFNYAQEVLTAPKDRRDFEVKLELFVNSMGEVFSTKRDLIKILHRELDNANPKAIKIFKDYFAPVSDTLFEFFKEAQKLNIIRKELNPKFLALDFFALLGNALRNESMIKISLSLSNSKDSDLETFQKSSGQRVLDLLFKGALV